MAAMTFEIKLASKHMMAYQFGGAGYRHGQREVPTTIAPAAAKRSADARPMPVEAPVTTTTFPLMFCIKGIAIVECTRIIMSTVTDLSRDTQLIRVFRTTHGADVFVSQGIGPE